MVNTYGFTEADIKDMQETFQKFPDIQKVILFGSRAMGNFKKGSDVDIALVYEKNDWHLTSAIKGYLDEETNMPYFFDVLDLKSISSEELKEHIKHFGVTIYEKQS